MRKYFALVAFGLLGATFFLEGLLRVPALVAGGAWFRGGSGLTVLALGESTTQGGPTDNYPSALEALLREACPRSRIFVKNAGLAGARSDDVRRDLPRNLDPTPRVATIMMGINDLQGTGGPVAVVGRSPWRLVRLVNWLRAAYLSHADPEPVPANAAALAELSRWDYYRLVTQPLLNANRLSELEALHRAVLRVRPGSFPALLDLGNLLRARGDAAGAASVHKAALELQPGDVWVLWELIADFEAMGRDREALHAVDQLLREGATLPMPLVTNLAAYLERRHDPARRDALLAAAVRRAQAQAILQWLVANAGEQNGKPEAAERARAAALAAAREPYPEALAENYRAIVRELRESGAVVLALTYPRQPLAPLAALFPDHEVELVALEGPFNEAVKKEGYSAIFYDAFGGNFGHLTKRGNELLARILRERILQLEPGKEECRK